MFVLGIRLYLGKNGNKIGGIFTATGKLLEKLWDEDDSHYDDINYCLSQLEYLLDVPDLDYKNNEYSFAFKKSAITNKVRQIIDELNYYLNEIDYEIIEEVINVPDIEYEDDKQFAYKVNRNKDNVLREFISDVQSDTSFEISDRFNLITHPALDSSKFEDADCEFEILNDYGNGRFQIGVPKNVTRKQFELALNFKIPNKFSIVDLYANTTKCYKIDASEVFDKQEKDYIYFVENKYKSYDKVFVNKQHVYKDNNSYYIEFDALNRAFKNKQKNMPDYINSNCIHYAEIESYKFNR